MNGIKIEDQEYVISPQTGKRINVKQLLKDQKLAYVFVCQNYPFYEIFLKELIWIYTWDVPTQATDGTRLFVNPEFTADLSLRLKCFVMMHEVLHCVLDHIGRAHRAGHPTRKSNIAADYEVNGTLVGNGVVSASDIKLFLYDKKYTEPTVWAYEHIYDDCSKQLTPPNQSGSGSDSGNGSGNGSGSDSGSDSGSGSGNGSGNGQSKRASAQSRQEAAKACGECDGQQSAGGMISQDAGADIAKAAGYTGSDVAKESQESVSRKWKDTAIKAASKIWGGKGMFGDIKSKIEDIYLTNHNWKAELRKIIGKAVDDMEKTGVKYGHEKYLQYDEIRRKSMPGQGKIENIIFMIDTSGSISDQQLQRILSECYTILYKNKIDNVTYCFYENGITQIEYTEPLKTDNIVSKSDCTKLKKGGKLSRTVKGRGCNDEHKAFDDLRALMKLNRDMEVPLVIWFHDGHGNGSDIIKPKEIENMYWVIYDNKSFEIKDKKQKVIHISLEDVD